MLQTYTEKYLHIVNMAIDFFFLVYFLIEITENFSCEKCLWFNIGIFSSNLIKYLYSDVQADF